MKKYLAYWYDFHREKYIEIEAENLTEAKGIAFRKMCDVAGDHLYSITLYEQKTTCNCQGECNPKPTGAFRDRAERDYMTGKFKRR